jgi:sugar transferase (PEP-CTERM/EpsH1 system associated)
MRVLFIAPYVPSRIRVRPFHIIMELAKRHDVTVVALEDSPEAARCDTSELADAVSDFRLIPHSKFKGYCGALTALPTRTPMCTSFCKSALMSRTVAQLLRDSDFDVIHVEHMRAARFAPKGNGIPVVFDAVDCLTDLFSQMARSRGGSVGRLLMAEEAWKLRRYEPRVMRRFDKVIVTSDAEQEKIAGLDNAIKAEVVPNGVDTEHFAPEGAVRRPARLVFTGKMGYMPNAQAVLWFAENVLPGLQGKFADLEFVIVGKDPSPAVRKLDELAGVSVTGYVDDTRPHVDCSSVAVAPMQIAVGVQNKVLESMAMGLPVVTTPIAAQALGTDCPGIVQCRTAEDMIVQICRLIEHPDNAAEIGRLGREEVKTRFSWQASVARLEQIYEEVIA